jgi:hypothetical protein
MSRNLQILCADLIDLIGITESTIEERLKQIEEGKSRFNEYSAHFNS